MITVRYLKHLKLISSNLLLLAQKESTQNKDQNTHKSSDKPMSQNNDRGTGFLIGHVLFSTYFLGKSVLRDNSTIGCATYLWYSTGYKASVFYAYFHGHGN